MGYILAHSIRERKVAKAKKAYEASDKPTSEEAFDRMTRIREAAWAKHGKGVLCDFDDKSTINVRKRFFTAKNVWIGALIAEGKPYFSVT